MISLKKKTAIITGASRGIGKAIAKCFSEAGANVVLCSRHENPELFENLKKNGNGVLSFKCDVSNVEDIKRVVDSTIEKFSSIEILANVAGISPKAPNGMKIPFHEMDLETWKNVMEINLNSMFYFSHFVVPHMMKNKYGRIINMSSIVGLTNSEHGPASSAYVTSKTGVIGLTKAMAYDLAPFGITVNAVAAGRISTDMSASNNEFYNKLHLDLIPMHRFGTPEEVANLFLFLASDDSAYITGQTTNITGGWFI